ncbi:amino acid adenylation domain-containing protein [Crossiella sp. NPDC003009]
MDYLLHHYLDASVAATPHAVAVVDGGGEHSYAALSERADRIRGALHAAGVRPGDRVGVHAEKSVDTVAAIYAVLRAGATYVCLDPQAPPARLATVVADGGLTAVLADEPRLGTIPGARVLPLAEAVTAEPHTGPAPATEGDLAYLIYTSGSTGAPKGVMLSHRNAMAFVDWAVAEFAITAADRLSSHAPFHFDLSILDLFAAAKAGAAVVLVPPRLSMFPVRLAQFIAEQRISVWYSVPAVLSALATRAGLSPGALPALRLVLFAGEVFPVDRLRALMELLPGKRFANLYGPTETNVCTWHELDGPPPPGATEIPIGRAIANTRAWAAGPDGQPVPPGEVGELYVRGATVMRGYWGDPARSAEKLVPNPLTGADGDLVFRTGDLVRADDTGSFTFIGRRDGQIKKNGYRVELGEIESVLNGQSFVDECAVVAVPDAAGSTRIEAFLVLLGEAGVEQVYAACRERLPGYLVPDAVHLVPAIPRTSTGKVDRQRLAHSGGRLTG